jgi:hypothetical protein
MTTSVKYAGKAQIGDEMATSSEDAIGVVATAYRLHY